MVIGNPGSAAHGNPAGAADQAWLEREQDQARAWGAIGARYDEAFPHKDGQLAVVTALLELLPPGARVLDLGSGTGLPTARQLIDAGCRVTCLDLSPRMLQIAEENVPEAEFVLGDVMDLSTDGPRFEAVTAFFVLLHLPREKVRTALGLIRAALVPGGRLALGMVEGNLDDAPIAFLESRLRVTGFLRDDLRALLTECGFAIEREQVLSYSPETTSANPEIQMFFLCRKGDEES